MTIGIIGAMEEEITGLRENFDVISAKNIVGLDFYMGKLENSSNSLVFVRCGTGKVNAAICAQILIDLYAVDSIVSIGVASGVANELAIGDVVLADTCVYHDFDTVALGDEPGEISRMTTSLFNADEELIRIIKEKCDELEYNALIGKVASGDQFVTGEETKNKIWSLFKPLCIDMEATAIAHTCYLNKIPFVVLRAISEIVAQESPMDLEKVYADCAVKILNIVKATLETGI